MQQREQNLVMADEFEPLSCRTIQDVYSTAVLRLLVHVDGNQPFEAVAEIPHHADRFQEDLWQDYGTSEIEPYAVLHPGDDATEAAKVDERCFAEGSAGDVRVHMDGIRPERDVDGARDAGPVGCEHETAIAIRTAQLIEVAAQSP